MFTILIHKENSIKTALRFHVTSVRLAIIRKPNDKCRRGCGTKDHSYTVRTVN
jgi:hypothetical protein